MPSYNFKERFADFVKDGSKQQTIRAIRKNPAKKGDMLYLFTGLRTRHTKRLRDEPCHNVDTIFLFYPTSPIYIIPGAMTKIDAETLLEKGEKHFKQSVNNYMTIRKPGLKDNFAWLDGFRHPARPYDRAGCYNLMLDYWSGTHSLPFVGHVIYWLLLPF